MAKLMMDAIKRVFNQTLEANDIDDIQDAIATLDDEQKIDLLYVLVEATMNYNDYYRGPGRGSPIVPPVPSGDEGVALMIQEKMATNMESEAKEDEEVQVFLTR